MNNHTQSHPANFNRPPRTQSYDLPIETVELPAPPNLTDYADRQWWLSIIPIAGIGVMAVFYLILSAATNRGALLAIPLLFMALFTTAATVIAGRARKRDQEMRRAENELTYLRLLEKKRTRLQAAREVQQAILKTNFPGPDALFERALMRDQQLWERRPEDLDFITFRLGTGRVPSQIPVRVLEPDKNTELLHHALHMAEDYRTLEDAPVTLSLQSRFSIGVYGKRAYMLPNIRALIAQISTTHAPQDLHIYLISSQSAYEDWRWLAWLPHTSLNHRGGDGDFIAFDPDNIRNLMGSFSQLIDQRSKIGAKPPHLLVIIDGPQLVESEPVYSILLREGYQLGASVVCLVNTFENVPGDCNAVIEIDEDHCHYSDTSGTEMLNISADQLSLQDAEHMARALAAVVMQEAGISGRIPRYVDFLDLYDTENTNALSETIHRNWQRAIPNGVLPYPVRIGRESLAVDTEILLDEDHHGPHGVLAGTTGSGKSEFLQTLICSMVLEHDPRLLNLLLIDFKGGSTFNIFAELPHTVGVVTNLDRDRVDRALQALRTEIEARQQFLEQMNVRDVTQYHRYYAPTPARIHDRNYRPLPHLFIIVDEFAQLAKEMPDFMQELVRIAQVGRSLGLHLILGTQSPMDVITDEMNDNLQFRICLRVQNVEASRAMLRRPDAAYLPAGWPGRGYFQVGERGMFKQFQTAYVGGDYRQRSRATGHLQTDLVLEIITDGGKVINLMPENDPRFRPQTTREGDDTHTTAKAIVDTITNYTRLYHIPAIPPLLLPPLVEQVTLAPLFGYTSIGGWDGRDWAAPGYDQRGYPIRTGSAPIGLLDDVYRRTQEPFWVHLNAGQQSSTQRDGHILVMGGPGTGKTTFLRTLAVSQALLHPPERLHMYFLSFTGSGLNHLSHLPHAEQVIHGTESERVRRLFNRLIHILDERQSGEGSMPPPTIMVCIDQYEQFRDAYYDQYMPDFDRLVNEGRSVGIYLVITASSVSAVPERVRSLIQQRIALQLGNPGDYAIAIGHLSKRLHETLPPGRGFIAHTPPLACQISLPCFDMQANNINDIQEAMVDLIHEMQYGYAALKGVDIRTAPPEHLQTPPPIKELPVEIPLGHLPLPQYRDENELITTLGRCDDDSLSEFVLDWWGDGPHFIVTGPPGSGKTNLLQAAVLAACQQYAPYELRLLLVDLGGRHLRELSRLKHTACYITDISDFEAQITHLKSVLQAEQENRLNHKIIIIIDDYDTVSEACGFDSPVLKQLRDLLRLYNENGVYLWVAGYLERPSDPLIKQLLLRRSGFGMGTKDSLYTLNVRTAGLPSDIMPQGRAYFAQHNTIQVVQTALVENPRLYVNRLNEQVWVESHYAKWESDHKTVIKDDKTTLNHDDLEIDTQGLIEDLLGNASESVHDE